MTWTQAGGDASKLALLSHVGRVETFVDGNSRCLAGIHPDLPTVGAIGDWVGDDGVRTRAEAWLREQGCTEARGPMELCTWFKYRVSMGPTEEPPFLLEPVEPPDRWLAAGYAECASYTSTVMPHDPILKANRTIASKLEAEGWSVRSLPRGDDGLVPEEAFAHAIDTIHHIAHEAFADAFHFTRLPLPVLRQMYTPLRPVVDPDLVLFADAPNGEPAGFVFGLPDLAAPDRRWAIIKTSAIRPKHGGQRVGTWLNASLQSRMRRKGFTHAVYALMWEGSASQHWSRYGGVPLRRYALLSRGL